MCTPILKYGLLKNFSRSNLFLCNSSRGAEEKGLLNSSKELTFLTFLSIHFSDRCSLTKSTPWIKPPLRKDASYAQFIWLFVTLGFSVTRDSFWAERLKHFKKENQAVLVIDQFRFSLRDPVFKAQDLWSTSLLGASNSRTTGSLGIHQAKDRKFRGWNYTRSSYGFLSKQ